MCLQSIGGHFATAAGLTVYQVSSFLLELAHPLLHLANGNVEGVGNVALVSLVLGPHIHNFKILITLVFLDHLHNLLDTNAHLKPLI